jgi:hypothetical protein
MQTLTKQGNLVIFREQELIYVSSVKLDDNAIHVNFETQTNLFFANDTELNGVVYANSDELINALNDTN